MRSIQFLPSYGSVSHGHPPTQQCDIGHSASFCLCLTERLRPLSSWDLYNLIFKRCGQRPILVFLVNCQNIDTMTTQANVTNYTKIKVGNISAVSGSRTRFLVLPTVLQGSAKFVPIPRILSLNFGHNRATYRRDITTLSLV